MLPTGVGEERERLREKEKEREREKLDIQFTRKARTFQIVDYRVLVSLDRSTGDN